MQLKLPHVGLAEISATEVSAPESNSPEVKLRLVNTTDGDPTGAHQLE